MKTILILTHVGSEVGMKDKKLSMYPPVLIVLILSIPLVYMALWTDFERAREMADDVVGNSGFFSGISEDKTTSITLLPEKVLDSAVSDTKENITITNSTGGEQEFVQSTPKGTLYGSVINALMITSIAVGAGFGIFLLFKYKRKSALKIIFTGALGLCSSLTLILYGYFTTGFLEGFFDIDIKFGPLFYSILIVTGFLLGSFIVYNMVFRSLEPKRKNPALIAFCVILGPFLSIVLDSWLILFLLILISLWDLWAAKRGIIKEMINLSEEHKKEERREKKRTEQPRLHTEIVPREASIIKGANRRKRMKGLLNIKTGEDITSYGLYEGKHYSLGIGDFIFFSLLCSAAFSWFMLKAPWMAFYMPVLGEILALELTVLIMASIILGLKHTLGFLEKDNVMPGLPISVLWGLTTFVLSAAVLQVLNLIIIGKPFNPF